MISRELYMQQIRPFIGGDLVKVITGMRRSGKSVMLDLIQEELKKSGVGANQLIAYNFENLQYAHLSKSQALYQDLSQNIKETPGKAYIFLDEIQEVEGWERVINSLRVEYDCDIYITGSNAKLLSGELATYLAGRYVEFVIYPFSYREYIDLYRETQAEKQDASLERRKVKIDERDLFTSYLISGGMPYLAQLDFDPDASQQYLRDVYNSVVLKDIVKRNNIRDIDLLERLIHYVFANIGTTFSANSISNFFKSEGRKVTRDTILNYIKAAEDAFLFHRASRYDIRGKQQLTVQEKFYIADHGVREALLGTNQRDIGLVFENIVYMELLRRGYRVSVGKLDNLEIDFIAEKKGKKVYIQVAYLLANEETIEREFAVYNKVGDNHHKYVISYDDFDFSRDGVEHLNIRDFLLNSANVI